MTAPSSEDELKIIDDSFNLLKIGSTIISQTDSPIVAGVTGFVTGAILVANIVSDSDTKNVHHTIDANTLVNLNKKLHNMIRNQQGNLKADKIHYDISRMFFYAFAQKYYDTRLRELVDEKYYKDIDGYEPCWMKLLKIEEILQSASDVVESNLRILWKKMLSNHPITSRIFVQSEFFKCDAKLVKICLYEIYKTTKDIDFDNLNEDIRGLIYEYYVNEYSGDGGQDFGQYFTPRPLIKSALYLVKEIYKAFSPKNVYDPCMGTGGFLVQAYQSYKASIDDGGYVYGSEIEPETYTSGYMNLLLSIKPPAYSNLQDTLKDNTVNKFDFIATNPPFSKPIDYDELIEHCNTTYLKQPGLLNGDALYPYRTNDSGALFLQHCMAKLAINGVCTIVLPGGKLLSSKPFQKLREALLTKFWVLSVMKVNGKAFKNASIGVVVITFMNYGGHTPQIKFYECDKTCSIESIKYFEDIPFDKIASKNYSLRYTRYRPMQQTINTPYPKVLLGTICEIKNGKALAKANLKPGPYPAIGGGKEAMGFHDTYNVLENTITISKDGSYSGFVNITSKKTYVTGHGLYLAYLRSDISPKYLYYYFKAIQEQMYDFQSGAGQPGVKRDELVDIPVPITTPEIQQDIINTCDKIVIVKKKLLEQNKVLKNIIENFDKHVFNPNIEKIKGLLDTCESHINSNSKFIDELNKTMETILI